MEEPPRLHLGSRTQTVSMVRDICYSEAMGGKAMLSGILLSRVSPVLFCFFFFSSGQNNLPNHILPGASSYMFFK